MPERAHDPNLARVEERDRAERMTPKPGRRSGRLSAGARCAGATALEPIYFAAGATDIARRVMTILDAHVVWLGRAANRLLVIEGAPTSREAAASARRSPRTGPDRCGRHVVAGARAGSAFRPAHKGRRVGL